MPIAVEDLLNQVDGTIRSAVRHKLRVSLRANDYREQNLDALDVLQEIRLKLIRRLTPESGAEPQPEIKDFSDYAAATAYRTCSDYLRAKYPVRTSLKNTLRRLLDKSDEFATWESASGELMCGHPGWRNPSFTTDTARVQELRGDPYKLPTEAIPRCAADHMRWPEWQALLGGVFSYIDGPLALDDLIAIAAPVVGMEDVPDAGGGDDSEEEGFDFSTLSSHEPTPYSIRLTTERLKIYWAAVLKLLVWHRVAYLLNNREGDLEALPLYGVATLEQIGDALEFEDKHFAALSHELGVAPPAKSQTGGRRFLLFWKYLPFEDNVIAAILDATRAQVISYRNKARERLKRMLRTEL
ncbi:MAG TPA: hypothetical protein VG893_06350 [Terracidiphilus sp.]|nr:hypothetical protein [Terracidiphilus sp.]